MGNPRPRESEGPLSHPGHHLPPLPYPASPFPSQKALSWDHLPQWDLGCPGGPCPDRQASRLRGQGTGLQAPSLYCPSLALYLLYKAGFCIPLTRTEAMYESSSGLRTAGPSAVRRPFPWSQGTCMGVVSEGIQDAGPWRVTVTHGAEACCPSPPTSP